MTPRALAALLLLAAPARAQERPVGDVAGHEDTAEAAKAKAAADDMARRLKDDPAAADELAARLYGSAIADQLTHETSPEKRLAEIRAWIDQQPETAAALGVGFKKDDETGTHDFEASLLQRKRLKLVANAGANKGILGRLKETGKQSAELKKQAEAGGGEEEKRETLRSLFEGKGSQSARTIQAQLDGKSGAAGAAGAVGAPGTAGLPAGYYDRLSQANLRGYSPQLQAMQSQLNARRAPGAPKLIETGKLDYETLSYPAFGMRFDVDGLDKRLRYERAFALARLLGLSGAYRQDDLLDPKVQAELDAKAAAAGKTLPPAFARRAAALARARAALEEFSQAAQPAKDPAQITKALLLRLGSKQKEAARWITVASLEDDAQRLEADEAFLTPELRQAVGACAASEADRAAYLRRGEELQASVKRLRETDLASIAALESDDWLSKLDEVQRKLDEAAGVRRDLSAHVEDYRSTAFRFAGSADARPSWRRTLDGYAERLLPSSGYARRLRSERAARELLADVFAKIAAGNAQAAHTVLQSYEPARPAGR